MEELLEETKLNSVQIKERLRNKYWTEGYACFEELGNDTGTMRGRAADFLVVGLWPSNYSIKGFEIKVSRADLIKEMQDENKWRAIGKYCDEWWLVVADKKIVKLEELPQEWGVMYCTKESIRTIRMASKLTPEPISIGFTRSLICKLLNREITEKKRSYNDGYNAAKQVVQSPKTNAEYTILKDSVDRFVKDSGVDLNRYNGGFIGKDFKEFVDNKNKYNSLQRNVKSLESYVSELNKIINQIKEHI